MAFSGNKDADRLILQELDDRDLFSTILANKYLYSLTDENFWRNRLNQRYPSLNNLENKSWKEYYLSSISLIDKIKRKYGFNYTQGDLAFIQEILEDMPYNLDMGLVKTLARKNYDVLGLYILNKIRNSYAYDPLDLEGWVIFKKKMV